MGKIKELVTDPTDEEKLVIIQMWYSALNENLLTVKQFFTMLDKLFNPMIVLEYTEPKIGQSDFHFHKQNPSPITHKEREVHP